MTEVQLKDMLRTVDIYEKPGHRVKFFAAFSILKPKKKHGVQKQVDSKKEESISLKKIWRINVQKLWVPNSLTEKIVFENDLPSELYIDIHNLISTQQFKGYVLSQTCSRWPSIQKIMSEKSSIDKLLDPNSKDRQVQHFQRLCSQDFSAKVGDKNVAENMKLILKKKVQNVKALFIKIKAKQSCLFNKSHEIKLMEIQ